MFCLPAEKERVFYKCNRFQFFQIRRSINMPDRLNVRNFIHGGDYNPDQWTDHPEIIAKDFEMFKEAKINSVTVGIFAWDKLEPSEGTYDFSWLDDVFDRAEKQGCHVILSTPSGARPRWMAEKYPEVLRVDETGRRQLFGERHNHCYTSPVYRKKVQEINRKLRRTLRQARKPRFVAYFKRIRRRMPLRALPAGIQKLDEGQVQNARQPEPLLLERVLEPPLHKLGPNPLTVIDR